MLLYMNTIIYLGECVMLLKIFAAIGVSGSVLHTAIAGQAGGALKVSGVVLLRFFEYFFGAHLVYALAILLYTELFVRLDEPRDKPSKFWQWHLHAVAELLQFYARVDLETSGRELIPKDTRYLMVANHRSLVDPVVTVIELADEELVYVSKPGNYKIPLLGKVMHLCGCLSMDRENNRQALQTIKQATDFIDRDLTSVVIYPEGTRCRKNELLPFHAGSFKIAQRANVPVVVAALRNTDRVIHNFPLRRTKVYLDILGVIDRDYVKTHKTKEVALIAQQMIQDKLDAERE